jgi:hypothetical protein
MKFAKFVFWIAAIWGIVVIAGTLLPLPHDRPPVPASHYSSRLLLRIRCCALAWQFCMHRIARDPVRFRAMIIPSVLEKFSFAAAQTVLYFQHRLHPSDLLLGGVDGLLGVLFLLAFVRTSDKTQSQA